MSQVIHDFGIRYKQSDVEGVDDYLEYLDEQNADRIFLDTLMRRYDFENLKDSLDDYL